jgi:molybdate transport system ATP-binding protein
MTLSVALRHAFPGFALDLAFEAPAGVTALFGRSGAGKTTVVNAVAGLLRPAKGRIVADGEVLLDTARGLDLPPHRRRVGYVFQDGRLFPHLTVRENLLYGARFAGGGEAGLDHVVEMLGIGALLGRRPLALSGGEKQRVAIGRALLARPRLLLMDEPLAALDAARKAEILPYVERLSAETGLPILYVSHSVAEVARLAATVVVLAEGRVARAGPVAEVFGDPDTAPLLGLREAGAVLTARVVAHAEDGLTELSFSGGRLVVPRIAATPGAAVRLRIQARDVVLALSPPQGISALNVFPVTVTRLHPGEGPGVMVGLKAGEAALLARVTRRSAAAMGLCEGLQLFAVLEAVAPAPGDVSAVL